MTTKAYDNVDPLTADLHLVDNNLDDMSRRVSPVDLHTVDASGFEFGRQQCGEHVASMSCPNGFRARFEASRHYRGHVVHSVIH